MSRRRTSMLLNPEIAKERLAVGIAEAFERFGQEMPAFKYTPMTMAEVIADLTRRQPAFMREIFENPDVREAYTRAMAEQAAEREAEP